MAEPVLEFKPEQAQSVVEEIMERSGQNIIACYQCRRCAAGCPVGEETGYVTPDRLIRMILLGDREKALNNELVWKCTSCYTCGTRCPNEIQTARITETLKQMSKEEHIAPLAPKVASFHHAFLTSTRHLGRLNELEFMGLYEIKNTFQDLKRFNFKGLYHEGISQTKLGLAMTKNKRMHVLIEKVKGLSEIKHLFKKARLLEKAKKKRDSEKILPDRG
jgi:heterodisulfide reductase subunit C2